MKTSDKLSFASKNARFVSRYAPWILVFFALVTVVLFPFARKLTVKANFMQLLPSDAPSIRNLEKLTEEVGGTSYLIVVVESPDRATAVEAAKLLSEKSKTFPDIEAVDNRTSEKNFEESKLLFLKTESLKKLEKKINQTIGYYRRKLNPLFIDLLDESAPKMDLESLELESKVYRIGGFISREEGAFMRVLLLQPAHPLSDFESSERLFKDVEKAAEEIKTEFEKPVTFGLTGPYKTRYDEYRLIQSDIRRTGFLAAIFLSVLMALFFRRFFPVFLGFFALSVGVFWTAAFAAIAIGYLNIISAFLLMILFGLGIDFSIHFLLTYEEQNRFGGKPPEVLERTYHAIGKPSLTSALTTSIAFLSLTVSEFQGFSHFGIIAGVGILLCFLAIFYILPSILILFPGLSGFRWTRHFPFSQAADRKRGPIILVITAGILFSLYSIPKITNLEFEYSFKELQQKNATAIELAERIGDHFGVVLNPVALITPGYDRAVEVAASINNHVQNTPDSYIDFAASVESHIPKEQEEKKAILSRIRTTLDRHEQTLDGLEGEMKSSVDELRGQLSPGTVGHDDLPAGILRQYEGKSGDVSIVYVYPRYSILDGRRAKKFMAEIRSMDFASDITIAGEPVIYVDILELLDRDTPRAMMLSLGIVILLLLLHFRGPGKVMWVLAPALLGFLWLAGVASLVGLRFNYINLAILPSILGVGIDNGIYIFHRYKNEGQQTLHQILRSTGKAVILASLTTMAAFASLAFAEHRGMASLGKVGFIGFATCLVASVVFIPAFIEFLEHKYWRKTESHSGN